MSETAIVKLIVTVTAASSCPVVSICLFRHLAPSFVALYPSPDLCLCLARGTGYSYEMNLDRLRDCARVFVHCWYRASRALANVIFWVCDHRHHDIFCCSRWSCDFPPRSDPLGSHEGAGIVVMLHLSNLLPDVAVSLVVRPL